MLIMTRDEFISNFCSGFLGLHGVQGFAHHPVEESSITCYLEGRSTHEEVVKYQLMQGAKKQGFRMEFKKIGRTQPILN
jgi:hypothetical protein